MWKSSVPLTQYFLLKEGLLGCIVLVLGEKIHMLGVSKGHKLKKNNLHFNTFGTIFWTDVVLMFLNCWELEHVMNRILGKLTWLQPFAGAVSCRRSHSNITIRTCSSSKRNFIWKEIYQNQFPCIFAYNPFCTVYGDH